MLIVAFVCFIVLVAAWLIAPNSAPVAEPVAATVGEVAAPAAS